MNTLNQRYRKQYCSVSRWRIIQVGVLQVVACVLNLAYQSLCPVLHAWPAYVKATQQHPVLTVPAITKRWNVRPDVHLPRAPTAALTAPVLVPNVSCVRLCLLARLIARHCWTTVGVLGAGVMTPTRLPLSSTSVPLSPVTTDAPGK